MAHAFVNVFDASVALVMGAEIAEAVGSHRIAARFADESCVLIIDDAVAAEGPPYEMARAFLEACATAERELPRPAPMRPATSQTRMRALADVPTQPMIVVIKR